MYRSKRSIQTGLIPVLFVAVVGVGCSGSEHEGAVGTDRMEQGVIVPGEENAADNPEGNATDVNTANEPNANGASATNEKRGTTENKKSADKNADKTSGKESAEAKKARAEKEAAADELRGLRGKLVNELQGVRDRLKDGTRTRDQRQEDQARAASLAQGLEKLDRTLANIDASNEATWAQIKENSEKEVDEMRAWMEENEVDGVDS